LGGDISSSCKAPAAGAPKRQPPPLSAETYQAVNRIGNKAIGTQNAMDLSITRLKSVAYNQNAANACFTKESGLCTSQKSAVFWSLLGKFHKRVNRFKNNIAWLLVLPIFGFQISEAASQSVELPIAKSGACSAYLGNKTWNLFAVSDFNWMTSDNSYVGRMAEQFNLRFPLLQKSDEIKSSIFSLAASCESIVDARHDETTQKSQQNSDISWSSHKLFWIWIWIFSIFAGVGIRTEMDMIWPKSKR
jgi:hypothetical protein